MTPLEHARAYLAAGISIVPIALDGTKRPPLKWGPYQERLATPEEALEWWGRGRPLGLAAVCGAISGGLELLDFDGPAAGRAAFRAWATLVEAEWPGLFDRLAVVKSPAGAHAWIRCREIAIPGNQVLARDGEGRKLIETRGEGGYGLVPGCPASCHPTGKMYEHHTGPVLEQLGDLSIEEHDFLIAAARSLDASPAKAKEPALPADSLRPGEDFERKATWAEVLEPAGWCVARVAGEVTYWRRPGKERGWSATTGKCRGADGADLLRVFTSSTGLEPGAYGKFRAFAQLNHQGDLAAAAKALAAMGYGAPPARRPAARPVPNGHHTGGTSSPSGGTAEPEITVEPSTWPAPPDEAAYSGVAGEIVAQIAPQTEADPVAVLVQVLVMFGSAIGRTAHWTVEGDRHHGNLYACLVGETAKGRKGTSKGRALQAMEKVEGGWRQRVMSGLSSGEGLIHAVRDPVYELHQVKQKGRVVDTQMAKKDDGERDKRLLVVEPELGRVLKVMEREGNTLSARLREAWDGQDLSNLTKCRMRATGPHISLLGHVTRCELVKLLSSTDAANGLANRFLWVAVKRSKLLPLGGDPVDLGPLAHKVALAVEEASKVGEVPFAPAAAERWCATDYARLSAGRPGLLGAILNRAEAQVRRIALLYALLDFSREVRVEHLRSALALWSYCERSAAWTFGQSSGSRLADDLLDALRSAGAHGMTGRDLHGLHGRHLSAREIKEALALLLESGLAWCRKEPTAGRPAQRWFITCEKSETGERSCAATT